MTSPVSTICIECGSEVDATLLGGVCPRCLLGDVVTGGEEKQGEDFDGHELMGEIARGGMGVVYRARQLEPDRVVALKTLRAASLDSPEAMARFRHEAEIMVALDHAAILPVYHCGEMDGIPFFTMKLVEGGTLAEHIGDYSGKWREIAELMATVCDGVRHAHERGVLHRDLKPGNILFDSSGQAYVSDFGIAKLADSQNVGLTMTMSVIGTPHYLAPEIAAGSVKAASGSSDVWSLGVILYELLTGEKPFKGESVTQVLRALDAEEANAPTKLRADVPRDLEVIALKALSREPARRYASAQMFADDLRAWLEDRPITARAVPAHERARLWARRNPRLASTATLLVLALIGAASSLVWGFVRVKQENARVVASEAETRAQLRDSLMQQAHAGRIARETGWRAAGIGVLREAHAIQPGDDVRDEMIAHLAGFDLSAEGRVISGRGFPSPGFESYVHFATLADKSAVLRRMSDDTPLGRLPEMGDLMRLQVVHDPRGRWMAAGTGTQGRVFALPELRELARWPAVTFRGASADGARLFVEEVDCFRVVRSADWSDELRLARSKEKNYLGASFDPLPGAVMMASAWRHEIELADWRTGATLRRLRPLIPGTSFAWCDGMLVAGCSNGMIHAFDLRRERSAVLASSFAPPNFYQPTSDGALLLTSCVDGVTQLWHQATGARLALGRGLTVQRLSTNDRDFLTAGPQCRLGRIEHSPCLRLVPDRLLRGTAGTRNRSLQLSADGRLMVVHDGRFMVLHEVSSGSLLARLESAGVSLVAFSPDGRELWVAHSLGLSVYRLQRRGARLALTLVREVPPPSKGMIVSAVLSGDRARVLVQVAGAGGYETRMDDPAWQPWRGPADATIANAVPSPDDRWLAGVPASRPYLVARDGAQKTRVLDIGHHPGMASFSADGRWLIFTSTQRAWSAHRGPDWDLAHQSAPQQRTTWTNTISAALEAAFSPDGRWFATLSDGTDIELVETGSWRVMARLHSPLEIPVSSMTAGADGASLIVQRTGGPVEIWDLQKLADELRERGIELRLPPPCTPPPTPPELEGEFEALVLPPVVVQPER